MTDKETFRHVIGHFASGVTVLTARNGDEDFGATASAVSSLSLDPPMLLVCLNTRGSTQQAIHGSRMFGVNILDEDQGIVAERFASSHGPKFEGLNVERGDGGVPLLADSLAYCQCQRRRGRGGRHAPGVPRECDARGGAGGVPADLLPGEVRPVRGRAGPGGATASCEAEF